MTPAKLTKWREQRFAVAPIAAPLPVYCSLFDNNLRGYFTRDFVRASLRDAGLLAADGALIDPEFRKTNVRLVELMLERVERRKATEEYDRETKHRNLLQQLEQRAEHAVKVKRSRSHTKAAERIQKEPKRVTSPAAPRRFPRTSEVADLLQQFKGIPLLPPITQCTP